MLTISLIEVMAVFHAARWNGNSLSRPTIASEPYLLTSSLRRSSIIPILGKLMVRQRGRVVSRVTQGITDDLAVQLKVSQIRSINAYIGSDVSQQNWQN